MQKSILIVEDNIVNLEFAVAILKSSYKVYITHSGVEAIQFLEELQPDLVLLDIYMPEMDGFETIHWIKENPKTANIPVIFLTAANDVPTEVKCLDLGAVDFISKPFEPKIMLSRVNTHIKLASYSHSLENAVAEKVNTVTQLEHIVTEKTKTVHKLENAMVIGFSELIEWRDNETGGHVQRTIDYAVVLANQLKHNPKYNQVIDAQFIYNLRSSVPLHDIGKIGIRDSILLKPGKLTEDEFEIMKGHTTIGGDALHRIMERTICHDFLLMAMDIAYTHHEKWDGTGYPQGLKGEEIPLSGRIMALADVYDALISERVYKKAFSHEAAYNILSEGRGSHFDPDLVDAFKSVHHAFRIIAKHK